MQSRVLRMLLTNLTLLVGLLFTLGSPSLGFREALFDLIENGPGDSKSGTAEGSCSSDSTGICNEFVSGDSSAFRTQCEQESDSSYSEGGCDGSWSYSCFNAQTTSDGVAGTSNIYWPVGFCSDYPYVDNRSTCQNLSGTASGVACSAP